MEYVGHRRFRRLGRFHRFLHLGHHRFLGHLGLRPHLGREGLGYHNLLEVCKDLNMVIFVLGRINFLKLEPIILFALLRFQHLQGIKH